MSNLPTKKQLRAYFLVEVMGETQVDAAKVMGVTRQTVSRWLKKFYDNAESMNKGNAAKTISLPGDFEDHIKDIF